MGHMHGTLPDILVHMAGDAPNDIAEGYRLGLKRQIVHTPAYLNRVEIDELRQPGNRLLVVKDGDRVTAGLYTKPGLHDAQPIIWINGLFSLSTLSGIGSQLIAQAVRASIVEDKARLFGARVRVMPTGEINAAAARAFARNGFFAKTIATYDIAATPVDAHLSGSAEPDGATYKALTLLLRVASRDAVQPLPLRALVAGH